MVKKIKVLIVDDSALIRMLLTKALSGAEDIEVVGAAEDPFVAREMIKKLQPDVITLDIEMPKMDGLTFLKNLMRLRPIPVVMVSTSTKDGAKETLTALEYGAVDFVAKPNNDIKDNLQVYTTILIDKIRSAAKANVASSQSIVVEPENEIILTQSIDPGNAIEVIAIGASTGGTEAIKSVVTGLPTNLPPIVMAQHIPPLFSTSFAKRLNETSAITVIEPTEKMELKPGHAYLAPGNDHLIISRIRGKLFLNIESSEPVNRHRPSVDVLFNSVAKACGKNSIAILLTGMGTDGAKGLKLLKDRGAHTIAQDEASSVVWGMPGAAVALGAACEVLDIQRISKRLVSLVYGE